VTDASPTILAVVIDAREEAPIITVTRHHADVVVARAADVLSAFEMARCARVMLAPSRALRTAAHVLKREALGELLALPARDIALVEPCDRPMLAAPHAALHVSLSHTHDAVAIALGAAAIGVDIEATERSRETAGMARRFFAPGEADVVARAATGFEFAWRWTAKEALKKAADINLFDALARPMPTDIDPRGGFPRGGFTAHGARFDVFEPAPGYVCSVARTGVTPVCA